jgi:hypothetical protein
VESIIQSDGYLFGAILPWRFFCLRGENLASYLLISAAACLDKEKVLLFYDRQINSVFISNDSKFFCNMIQFGKRYRVLQKSMLGLHE